jgi:radical SAM superfamily enzyme YgiQ (UPF0313 family)
MKKKLLLVEAVCSAINYISSEADLFPPLSLAFIGALTPADEWEIDLVTENKEFFKYRDADLVGITSFSMNIARAYQIASMYKNKNIPVVMGGPHVSFMTEEALNYCTSVVIGEAESAWPKVLEDYKKGKLEKVYKGEMIDLAKGGSVIPRHDLYYKKYKYYWAAVQTKRGCPLNCHFCSVTAIYGPRIRTRPSDEIVRELSSLPQKYIIFCDNNFIGTTAKHEEEAIDLLKEMDKRGIKKKWCCYTTINFAFNDTLLYWMQKTGCCMVFIGFEAIDDADLKSMNKKFNQRYDYKTAIDKMRSHGIALIGSFIIGIENQTPEKIAQIIDYGSQGLIDIPLYLVAAPFPGTKWWDTLSQKLKYNDLPFDYTMLVSNFFCGFENANISDEDWKKIRADMFRKSYSWKRILKSSAYWLKKRDIYGFMNVLFTNWGFHIMYKNLYKIGKDGDKAAREKLLEIETKADEKNLTIKILIKLYEKLSFLFERR